MIAGLLGPAAGADAQAPGPEMHYSAEISGNSVVLHTDTGSLSVVDGQLRILDPTGVVVGGIPLNYQRDGKRWPIAASVHDTTAQLTPSTDPGQATPAPPPPGLDPESDTFNDALSHFSTQVGVGAALGGLIGTVIGAGVGCLAGGLVAGATAAVPTVGVLAIPGFLGGCLVTAAAAAAIGGVAGTIAVGVPVAIAAGILFFNTVNAPH
ncbi:hypothetical protein IU452_15685 [Nocardia transvalensis]|nr:hypothetical protein [Nocardia transvalensis]